MSSDIRINIPLFRRTPPSWHPYIKLMRLDRPIGIWLLLLPCWWGMALGHKSVINMAATDWYYALLFAVGAVLMRSAGCVINDLWDRKLDAAVERTKTRPLASGELSVEKAYVILGILLTLSLIVLLRFNMADIILGVLSLGLVVAYPLMKRHTWWPQLFLGFTFNWGILMGWAEATGTLGLPAVFLYIGGIFWTLAYDTIYAHQDTQDDALIGVKSTALLFGDKSPKYVAGFFAAAIVFILIAKYMAAPSFMTALFLAPVIAHIVWQLRSWDKDKPESCLKIFKSNQVLGWLILLVLGF